MEHRCGARHTLDFPVSLHAGPHPVAFGSLLDVSASGAYIATSAPLAGMSLITVQLTWGGRENCFEIAAHVVRTDTHGVGIEWREFAPRRVRALIHGLEEARPQSARRAAGGIELPLVVPSAIPEPVTKLILGRS